MSESDDTDILLLIPPDLFTVASSQSDDSLVDYQHQRNLNNSTVVSELLEHVQSLEDRISAIEVKDISLDRSAYELAPAELRIPGAGAGAGTGTGTGAGSFSANTLLSDFLNEKNNSDTKSSSSFPVTRINYYNLHTPVSSISTPTNSPVKKYDEIKFNKNYRVNGTGTGAEAGIHVTNEAEVKNETNGATGTRAGTVTGVDGIGIKNLSFSSLSFKNNNNDDNLPGLLSLNTSRDKIESPRNKFEYPMSIMERTKLWESKKSLNTSTPKKSIDFNNKSGEGHDRADFFFDKNKKDDWKSQPLLSLTDFWTPDPTKSQDEILRIRLEEEKFRREHCEQMIQELQKRLLEQQEKIAVAIRVDKDKSDIITKFQDVWNKFRVRWDDLESEHNQLQSHVQELMAKHQQELESLNSKLNYKDEELKQTENLLRESEKKCESAVKDKLNLLEEHASELEKYKSLVQAADQRYDDLKSDFDKSKVLNEQLEQTVKNLQQELHRERLKNTEVRSEMSVVHKALDTCEAELMVLRQEKENLLLKLKEEENRVSILEKNKMMLLEDVNDTKKSESLVREEMKALIAQQELKKTELREMYQKQVDDVVNTKLKEFEAQLDAAELNFQLELESKQRAIAECAARKIKSIIDKHQLEINLIEEKHKEEKRLCEIRLSQTNKKAHAYETQLTAYHNAKSRLAEQLHSLMEKQYHQALHILTTGNTETFQLPRHDKSVDLLNLMSSSNFNTTTYLEPVKLNSKEKDKEKEKEKTKRDYTEKDYDESVATYCNSSDDLQPRQSDDDLKKYIKMILHMQHTQSLDNNITDNIKSSSPLVCREVPKKYYLKADSSKNNSSEELYPTKSTEDISTTINTEYFTLDKNKCRTPGRGQEKIKPPWK
ncbi:synaptonemal complex protein 1 [Microplitis mediator]|uniref:synaptonemal complex protein 1 n=1 Tax=Microplitis mediator TaxID=375433 RepID=UPI002556DF32|nr:synaptonemal complex protein 1 [Microplitis mediator]